MKGKLPRPSLKLRQEKLRLHPLSRISQERFNKYLFELTLKNRTLKSQNINNFAQPRCTLARCMLVKVCLDFLKKKADKIYKLFSGLYHYKTAVCCN